MQRPAVSFGFPPLTRGVKWLMIATAVISIGTSTIAAWINPGLGQGLIENLVFSGATVLGGRVWQVATYPFLNLDPIWLLVNLLVFWMFASSLERRWRTRRFLTFFFGSTVAAALCTLLVGLVARKVLAHPYAGLGTSLSALTAAYALNFPDNQINFFFVIPIQARYLIHVTIAIMVLFILMTGSVLPYVCPMFGLVAGIVFSRGALKGPQHVWLRMKVWWIERRLANRKLRIVQGQKGSEPRPKSGSDGWLH